MYAIYKWEPGDVCATLITITLTKRGAKKACAHVGRIFYNETRRPNVEIRYEEVMYFPVIKAGYAALVSKRIREQERLKRLEYKETIAINNKFAQEQRVAALY